MMVDTFFSVYHHFTISRGRFFLVYIPYPPLKGSRNKGISGVIKVNITNAPPIMHINRSIALGKGQKIFPLLKSHASVNNATAAEIKNMVIFTQSGEGPIAPL